MTKKKEYREFNNVTVVVYDVSEDHKCFSSWKLLPDKSPTMHGKDLIETQALIDEKARSKKLLEALKAGGYNSIRETLALMVEGEGSNPETYQTMANSALVKLDKAIAQHEEGE